MTISGSPIQRSSKRSPSSSVTCSWRLKQRRQERAIAALRAHKLEVAKLKLEYFKAGLEFDEEQFK
jgi:hypothetical protein